MRTEYRYLLAAAFTALIVAAYAQIRPTEFESLNRYRSSPYRADLEVLDAEGWNPWNNGWGSFRAKTGNGYVRVVFRLDDPDLAPRPGEVWAVSGWLGAERRGTRKLWIRGSGAYARKVRDLPAQAWIARLARFKTELSRRMGIGLEHDPDLANLSRAIVLGERHRLSRDDRETFLAAGTMHIFAISGLHVMIVAKVVLVLVSLFALSPRLAPLVMLPVLWLYVYLIGLAPSAVRAATMATFYFAAVVLGREANSLVAWSLTFILVHLVSPMSILEVGNLLSFAVMFGLLLMDRYLRAFPRLKGRFLFYSFAAWAAGMPIVAHVFGRVTPAGLLANLALVPVAAVEVAVGFLGLLASFVSTRLAELLNNLAGLLIQLMAGVSGLASRIPGASLEVRPWSAWQIFAWYALIFLSFTLVRLVRLRRQSELC